MIIAGQKYKIIDTLNSSITVPDCIVKRPNKIGTGNGEAKLYIAPKPLMYDFFGSAGFTAHCFVIRQDLVNYLNAIQSEYLNPSQPYRGRKELAALWEERQKTIAKLPEVIEFNVHDQLQIGGIRGYIKSNDTGYDIIREISLPLVSYIFVMRLEDNRGRTFYYWKLFADFDAISDKHAALVYTYGKKGNKVIPTQKFNTEIQRYKIRQGQEKYRDALLKECPFCPITMINDERLLNASHIKPWAAAAKKERLDPKNGFILSPLYDRLFDRGLMTFSEDRCIILSNWIAPQNQKRLGIVNGQRIQLLPLDDEREVYMQFHREKVFKG